MKQMGFYEWDTTEAGQPLPCYRYTGSYPATARDNAGQDSRLPQDPCFILGNNRITAFAHVSGRLELITGERGWARLNHLAGNAYHNHAFATVNGARTELAGESPAPAATLRFGTGYAAYRFALPGGVELERKISVQPSPRVNEGTPALLWELSFANTGTEQADCAYTEEFLANYCMLSAQEALYAPAPTAAYLPDEVDAGDLTPALAAVQFRFKANKLMPDAAPGQRDLYDRYPPLFFAASVLGEGVCHLLHRAQDTLLQCAAEFTLAPGQCKTLQFVIGLSFASENPLREACATAVALAAAGAESRCGAFAAQWAATLPDLSHEPDETLRWELVWDTYVLKSMANYHAYFNETTIPQGSVYAYRLGQNTSVRDHLQHLLAAAYFDPALAKSSLRFVMKHICFDGRILRQDIGFGYEDATVFVESDPQLYLFQSVAEYLRITGDTAFLGEPLSVYPVEDGHTTTVMNALLRTWVWLRDTVGIGRHGLLRMLNSDWSDSFFHTYSPNLYANVAESHLNTAMALVVLPRFAAELGKITLPNALEEKQRAALVREITAFRAALYTAFMQDMEGRVYAPRCYIGYDDDPKMRFGEGRLCLEAQPWVLQMTDFPLERKKALYDAVKRELIAPEKLGARTRERPLWTDGEGVGEDGGMWFAHQGPLMLGVAGFDSGEARALMNRLTFRHFAACYPDYWMGQWTAADSVETSLSHREGLYHDWVDHVFQPFCAHAHAWMVYCYYRLFAAKNADNT